MDMWEETKQQNDGNTDIIQNKLEIYTHIRKMNPSQNQKVNSTELLKEYKYRKWTKNIYNFKNVSQRKKMSHKINKRRWQ